MTQAQHKMHRFPERGLSNERLMRLVRFPAVRKAISGALERAVPEKVEAGHGGPYVRFRIADPGAFHPALFATIPVGHRGTKIVIGTRKSAIKKPAALSSFMKRMGRGMKSEARRSLVYQLRRAGIIGGSETQAVLVPRDRVMSAVRMYASRAAANPLTRAEAADVLRSSRHDLDYATKPAKGRADRDARRFYAGRAVGKAWVAKVHGPAREGAESTFRKGYRHGMSVNPILATIGFNPGRSSRGAARNAYACYKCGKQIKGKVIHYMVPILHSRLGIDFDKAFHPACYKEWQAQAGRELGLKPNPRRRLSPHGRPLHNGPVHRFVPGITKWHMAAGGTAAAPDKHSYHLVLSDGDYYVDPISWHNGRHRAYKVMFANTQGRMKGPASTLLWHTVGMARSPEEGAKMARQHYDRHFGTPSNPLTLRESADLVREAKRYVDLGKRTTRGGVKLYAAGEARGLSRAVQRYGVRRAKKAAARMGGRASDLAYSAGAYANPSQVEIKVPFRDGQKISPARMRQWIDSLPENPITRLIKARFEKAMGQYKRFHLGSEPTSFTYRAIPMGSQGSRITDVDMVVSEGKEWAAPYQVPKSSGKYDPNVQGRYIHAHGDSKMEVDIKKAASTKRLPERFHTADGKFVGVVPSRNVKITDWYRG